MAPTFSIIVPTTGRPTLERALDSLARQPLGPGDEVLVSGTGPDVARRVLEAGRPFEHVVCPTGGNFGYEERTAALSRANRDYLLFLDDDDAYLPGALEVIRAVVEENPGRPILCRMIAPNGNVLWQDRQVRIGNQGTPCFVAPNDPARLGRWTPWYVGDFDFLVSTLALYPAEALLWDETILCACRLYAERVWTETPVL